MSKNCDFTLCQSSTISSTWSPRQCLKSLLITKQISNILRRIEHFRLPGNSIFKQFPASRYLDTSIKKRKYMYLHNVKIQMRQETSIPGIIRWITCARNYRTSSKSWEPYRLAYVQLQLALIVLWLALKALWLLKGILYSLLLALPFILGLRIFVSHALHGFLACVLNTLRKLGLYNLYFLSVHVRPHLNIYIAWQFKMPQQYTSCIMMSNNAWIHGSKIHCGSCSHE